MKSTCMHSVLAYLSMYLYLAFYLANANMCWPVNITEWKSCTKSRDAIRTLWGISVLACIDECNQRTSCKAVNFNRPRKQCELLRTDQQNTTDNGKRACVFIEMRDLHSDGEVQIQCQDCLVRQVCEMPQGECVHRECEQFNMLHGVVKGNMNNVGATAKIAPDAGYTLGSQSAKSVCTSNGTWDNIPGLMVSCDDGWQYIEVTGSCYKGFGQSVSFETAKAHCLSFGAHVVQFENQIESDAVKSFLSGTFGGTGYRWWIGVELVEGNWVYAGSNTTVPFVDWAPGEPNGNGGVACAELRFDISVPGWNDVPCTWARRPICEKG